MHNSRSYQKYVSLFPFEFRVLELILSLSHLSRRQRGPSHAVLPHAELILKCALWYSSGDLTQIEFFFRLEKGTHIFNREISENKRNNNSKKARKKFAKNHNF